MKVLALAAVVLFWTTQAAQAQQIDLRIGNGRVTLDAENVTVRLILSEWARVGGARVVNGELVGGGLVTLQLEDVPEAEALDIVLRGASGYIIAMRPAGAAGASVFDRIMVLASSDAPRAVPRRTITETPVLQSVVPTRLPQPLPRPTQPPAPVLPEPEPVEPDTPVAQPNPVGFPFPIPPGSSDRPGMIAPVPEPE